MWWRPTERCAARLTVAAVALLLAACGGRDSWLNEPLPVRAPVRVPAPVSADAARVQIRTSVGDVVVALYPERAPATVANFLAYVDRGFYTGTIFHRVEREFPGPAVVQAGGYTRDLEAKATDAPIRYEGDNGLSNRRGTLAMARSNDPDTATSQFYFNYVDNLFLDHRGGRAGYVVFGVVESGIEVIDRISMVPVAAQPGTPLKRLPMVEIVIESATRLQ